jgi:hypothetical protein
MLNGTPNELLKEFFARMGHSPPCIDWRRLKERQGHVLLDAIHMMPIDTQHQIEATLCAIFELACLSGARAMVEAWRCSGTQSVASAEERGPYFQAMWTWLNHPQVFDLASTLHQIDHLGYWRRRRDLPRVEPRVSAQTVQDLAAAISNFFRQEEGRGRQCSAEHYARSDGRDYFVAYPDNFVQWVTIHDKQGKLVTRSLRPTFEVVYAYDRQEGTLELHADVASDIKPQLERLFGEIVLGVALGDRRSGPPFDLNRLKDRYFILDVDPEDRVSASIRRMRLMVPQHSLITVEPLRNGKCRDVYDATESGLNQSTVCWNTLDILHAMFQFVFEPKPGRRSGKTDVFVSSPDHCSIATRSPERIDIVRKCFKHWGIARA